MIFLLSPAKTLDYETPVPVALRRRVTEPVFSARAAELVAVLASKTPAEMATLMALSDPLAALAVARVGAWQPQATADNSKPALLAFAGDVYRGLDAGTLGTGDLAWAQQHLVILSGLYGALRPLDRLQPYRLEMGTALPTARGKDLYAYWGDTVADYLNQRLAEVAAAPRVVNLASVEYAQVVFGKAARQALRAQVIDCVFEDWQAGRWRIISFHAKRARGLMARHAVLQRARSPRQLETFAAAGYALDRAASEPQRLVFRRGR
jgi:hypothetical protein